MLLCLHFSLRQGYSMCYLYTLSVLINWDYWPLVLSGPCGFRPTVSYLSICTLTNSSWSFVPMLLKQRACFLDSSAGKKKVAQFCPSDPMDCSPPGSSVHGISQARILEWVAISFSRGFSWPRNQTEVPCTAGRLFFTSWAIKEASLCLSSIVAKLQLLLGLRWWLRGKSICLQCGRSGFNPWLRKIPWRRDSLPIAVFLGFPGGSDGKESACNAGDLGWEDPLEKEMATHSSILA